MGGGHGSRHWAKEWIMLCSFVKASGEIKREEIGMLYVLASDAKNIGFLPDVLVLLLFKFEQNTSEELCCLCVPQACWEAGAACDAVF